MTLKKFVIHFLLLLMTDVVYVTLNLFTGTTSLSNCSTDEAAEKPLNVASYMAIIAEVLAV